MITTNEKTGISKPSLTKQEMKELNPEIKKRHKEMIARFDFTIVPPDIARNFYDAIIKDNQTNEQYIFWAISLIDAKRITVLKAWELMN